MSFWLFCLLVASNHLHLTARIPALGAMRFDLVLAIAATVAVFLGRANARPAPPAERETTRRLLMLVAFPILVLPFVTWPGSVIDHGADIFFRAVIYYFLAVGSIKTQRQLAIFFLVLGGTQVFRVLEPLYLHLTDGYWGSSTNMGNWTAMDRLSGAPLDVVNPNGLAYIVISTLPLLFYTQMRLPLLLRGVVWVVIGAMMYTLSLTGSRSGFLVLALLVLAWIWTSKHRSVALTLVIVFSAVVTAGMSDLQRDRYLSIFRSDVPGAATAQGRVDGVVDDFRAALDAPIIGHGLGTSYEVNTWIRGGAQISHDLYAETTQELGFVGLFLLLRYIWSAMKSSWNASKLLRSQDLGPALTIAGQVMPVMMATLFFFSFATYGLSEYQWYLLGGLSVVTVRIVTSRVDEKNLVAAKSAVGMAPAAVTAPAVEAVPAGRPFPAVRIVNKASVAGRK